VDAWSWQPSRAQWVGALRGHVANWSPEPLPQLVGDRARAALARAVASKSDWLYHPFVSPLVPGASRVLQFDPLQLPAWLALHSGLSFSLRLERPAELITATGEVVCLSGQVSSKDFAAAISTPNIAGREFLPIVGRASVGYRSGEEGAVETMGRIAVRLPRVASWVAEASKLANFLALQSDDMFASASYPEIPGYIVLTPADDVMQVLEAVVHETAHLYLFRSECGAALVRPSERLFASPLRPNPRPLRGVLLAMHACAYVSAAFAEAEAAGLEHPARCSAQRREMLALFDEAYETVGTAADLLTPAGATFVSRTASVAASAR
jgi:hypothetical protein